MNITQSAFASETPWIASVTGGLVVLLGGWGLSFVRDKILARDRFRGIAHLLAADIGRIRTQVGKPAPEVNETNLGGVRPVFPEIHPWVATLVADASRAEPTLAAHYLSLEKFLRNWATQMAALRHWSDQMEHHRTMSNFQETKTQIAYHHDQAVFMRRKVWEVSNEILERLPAQARRVAGVTIQTLPSESPPAVQVPDRA